MPACFVRIFYKDFRTLGALSLAAEVLHSIKNINVALLVRWFWHLNIALNDNTDIFSLKRLNLEALNYI